MVWKVREKNDIIVSPVAVQKHKGEWMHGMGDWAERFLEFISCIVQSKTQTKSLLIKPVS